MRKIKTTASAGREGRMGEFDAVTNFATELRKWWSFDDQQRHTHTWHSREDFIEKMLPRLLATARLEGEISEAKVIEQLRAEVLDLENRCRSYADILIVNRDSEAKVEAAAHELHRRHELMEGRGLSSCWENITEAVRQGYREDARAALEAAAREA